MINKKLYSININALNILDILLREKSITATGKILNLSQSAVSIVLKNLRSIFDDELLIRLPQKKLMELTPLALSIREPLRRAIEDIEKIVFKSNIQNTSPERKINLALTDAALMLFVPKLLEKLKLIFPKVTIDISSLFHTSYVNQLTSGHIDIAAGVVSTQNEPDEIYYKFLMKDHIICIAKKGHPILEKSKITLNEYKQYPRILSKYIKSPYDITNEKMTEYHDKSYEEFDSNKTLPIYSTLGSIPVLLETDRISFCSSFVYQKISEHFDIGYTVPDFAVSTIDYTICCLQKYKNDPVIETIFNFFFEIAKEYEAKFDPVTS